ncbi:hypothetical protein MOV61_10900 [Neorhizobium sp. BETTINA12A]|uniref:hypothetical protein n=1 Tax=Neorhizobium sp. BETTINA12A TaxID=2908924 RepID=UPI001FF6CE2C|nr:hypothetical protein [Neorhizobium sp. BETTINA12A]MCJ9751222.1 hypothetical protein [Neorhizobium sp. BETTINA12A]
MKTTRRNFVVEYKTNRRQPKTPANSIWGDTDLRALARAVESDTSLPHRIQPIEERPRTSANAAVTSERVKLEPSIENGHRADDPGTILSLDGEAGSSPPPQIELPAAIDAQPSPEMVAVVRDHVPLSSAEKPHVNVQTIEIVTPSEKDHPQRLSVHLPDVVSDDDLAALDAENRRLKKLLADKLRTENARLTNMLQRLGSL